MTWGESSVFVAGVIFLIERYCLGQEVEVAARIPFDNVFTGAQGQGRPVVAYSPDRVTREMESLWRGITHALDAWDGG